MAEGADGEGRPGGIGADTPSPLNEPTPPQVLAAEKAEGSEKAKEKEKGDEEMEAAAEDKWACISCTYLNWRSSLRCTLCRSPKPHPSIEEVSKAQATSEEENPHSASNGSHEWKKWCCGACTYLNWPRSRRCVQCRQSRDGVGGGEGDERGEEGSAQWRQGRESASPPPPTSSPPPSTSTSASISTSSALEPRLLAKKLAKWTCPSCTYENWQKAAACVMCSSQRPRPRQGRGEMEVDLSGRKSPKSASSSSSTENLEIPKMSRYERALQRLREEGHQLEVLWLSAVLALARCGAEKEREKERELESAQAFLRAGGEPRRVLNATEARLLNRELGRLGGGVRLEAGQSLLHLALKQGKEELLSLLLRSASAKSSSHHRSSSQGQPGHCGICLRAPEAAAEVRRCVGQSLRQRKGDFPCFYLTELSTFALPYSVNLLPSRAQRSLWAEMVDSGVRRELEEEASIINWAPELRDGLGSRLYPLWNRTAGDCLLDAVLQATWGCLDTENSLRQALHHSLEEAGGSFYPRWRDYELRVASRLGYSLEETQLAADWGSILQMASKPGSALEQAHILVLAHIVRRPIIVYGVRVVKSWRGEQLDYARFQGIYLPLHWEPSFCAASPIALAYSPGHFSALVPQAQSHSLAALAPPLALSRRSPLLRPSEDRQQSQSQTVYLALQDSEGALLPVHFLRRAEMGSEKELIRSWLDVVCTESGLLAAKLRLHRHPTPVAAMLDQWLDFYRGLSPSPEESPAPTPLIQDSLSSLSLSKRRIPGYRYPRSNYAAAAPPHHCLQQQRRSPALSPAPTPMAMAFAPAQRREDEAREESTAKTGPGSTQSSPQAQIEAEAEEEAPQDSSDEDDEEEEEEEE